MDTYGTCTFTIGDPIRLQGFPDGAAIPWSQDENVHERMKSEIEDMYDVFNDATYPYEDYYKYVEIGFVRGITEAHAVNEAAANWAGLKVVASLSALYRLDLDQNEESIMASYIDILKDHPSALNLLYKAGVDIGKNTIDNGDNRINTTKKSLDT